jgi:hypothetical protein
MDYSKSSKVDQLPLRFAAVSMDRQTGDLRGDLLVENERIAAISRILIKNGTIVVAC